MNMANRITILRILLVPFFMVFLLLNDKYPSVIAFKYFDVVAALIFVVAAATDGIDGYVARKYNQITVFGKFIDPLADKLLVVAALVCLVWMKKIDPVVTTIIITREFIVTSLRIVAMSEGKVIAASMWGKIKTISQIVAISAILLQDYFKILQIPCLPITLIYIALVITVYSGVDYIIQNRDVINMKGD